MFVRTLAYVIMTEVPSIVPKPGETQQTKTVRKKSTTDLIMQKVQKCIVQLPIKRPANFVMHAKYEKTNRSGIQMRDVDTQQSAKLHDAQ